MPAAYELIDSIICEYIITYQKLNLKNTNNPAVGNVIMLNSLKLVKDNFT
jgi:hypothetical protein